MASWQAFPAQAAARIPARFRARAADGTLARADPRRFPARTRGHGRAARQCHALQDDERKACRRRRGDALGGAVSGGGAGRETRYGQPLPVHRKPAGYARHAPGLLGGGRPARQGQDLAGTAGASAGGTGLQAEDAGSGTAHAGTHPRTSRAVKTCQEPKTSLSWGTRRAASASTPTAPADSESLSKLSFRLGLN